MSRRIPTVLLIGLRGSGKTTLGAQLAKKLHRPFVDLDDVTREMLGCKTIAEAWDKGGESLFRMTETRALRKVLTRVGQVVALGGGTPTAPGAKDLIRRAQRSKDAYVIYLRASPHTLRERLSRLELADRPSLTGTDTITEIDLIHARRDATYRNLADEVIDVDGIDERTALRELYSLF
ncbi:MAG: shikimate kinase [Planctomycetota bacterium]|nr:MAG: shikimate kinase [Planctomycetota bacterium]